MKTILCINGSDSLGHAGLQADIRTIRDLGAYAVTVVTSVTGQSLAGTTTEHDLPTELIIGQLQAVLKESHPDVIKIGMVNQPEAIQQIRREIAGRAPVICSPVILSAQGNRLMDEASIRAYGSLLLPLSTLFMIKCVDAEILLHCKIRTEQEMRQAAQRLRERGAQWVLLRGGTFVWGRIQTLLYGPECCQFYSSVNIEGWQRHGIGGTLSTAIAVELATCGQVPGALEHAHNYLHSQVVYAASKSPSLQSHRLYDRFLSLLADHYTQAHAVGFYAEKLSISVRYLGKITARICARSPKQVIDDYLLQESELLLSSTSLNIQQIACQLGFSSQIAFAKFFRAQKNCSPSAFRTGK